MSAPAGRVRVHVDTDPGLDDLAALALAFGAPELEVVGVTTVAGNAPLDAVTRNARAFLALAGSDVAVGVGAAKPLALSTIDATHFHGKDGVRGLALPEPSGLEKRRARDVLAQSFRQREARVALALGPLTNLAALARELPGALDRVEIVWMGGTLRAGNVTPVAEFNAYADPRALALLLDLGVRLRVIGLDVTSRVRLNADELAAAGLADSPRGRALAAALAHLVDAEREHFGVASALLHDPCAVAAVSAPELFRFEELALEVRDVEGSDRGRLLRSPHARAPRVHYAVSVDAPAVVRHFLERVARWCAA